MSGPLVRSLREVDVAHRIFLILSPAMIAVVLALVPARAAAQAAAAPPPSVCPDDNHAAFHACATARLKGFTPPRTPHGQPDFSGFWRRRAAAHEDLQAHPKTPDDAGGPSVVVDPADGLVPIQPWADARRKENVAKFLHHNAVCFQSGVPVTMYMTGLYQFVQTSDHLLIQSEEAHGVRIIPVSGRPHVGRDIKLWQGDSRARWEGNTLVIETTNQRAEVFLDQRGRFYTDEARVTERLTLLDANTMHYQATIDDPNVYTRPFTIALALRRNAQPGAELWEEACYEGNAERLAYFRRLGYGTYPGISGAEARELKAAFERQGGAQ
jgi:hypothetical protein